MAFSQCNSAEPYRAAQNKLMSNLFSNYKDIKLVISDAQQDNSKQIAQIETFIRQKPDLLIVAPNERAPLTNIMGEAIKAGIPTICLERDILEPNYTTYIRSDNFKIGQAITLKKGKDVSIFACGTMVKVALDCSKILAENGIDAEIINMHTIKPIDITKVRESAGKAKLVATIEEHNIIGGLGSAVAECLASIKNSPEQIFFGINDCYSDGGDYNFLKQKFNLTSDFVSKKIISKFKKE